MMITSERHAKKEKNELLLLSSLFLSVVVCLCVKEQQQQQKGNVIRSQWDILSQTSLSSVCSLLFSTPPSQ